MQMIDTNALIQRIDKGAGVVGIGLEPVMAIRDIKALISEIPTVDAAPIRHGQWIHLDPRECATISGKCSCCGWEAHYYEDDVADMPYCPNCGAKMI